MQHKEISEQSLVYGVECPQHRGARGAVDEERPEPLLQVLLYHALQLSGVHPTLAVHLHLSALLQPQPHRGSRALQLLLYSSLRNSAYLD